MIPPDFSLNPAGLESEIQDNLAAPQKITIVASVANPLLYGSATWLAPKLSLVLLYDYMVFE